MSESKIERKCSEHSEDTDDGLVGLESMTLTYSSSINNDSSLSVFGSSNEEKPVRGNPVSSSESHLAKHDSHVPIPASLPRYQPKKLATINDFVGGVIGPTNLMEAAVACPCCQQSLNECPEATLTETKTTDGHKGVQTTADHDTKWREDDDILPGSLGSDVHYHQKRVLVEGWLHKKGTGKDWLGSRAWKARWTRLVLARVEGYECDVPLLLIYWHPSSPVVSTAIILDSTVVMSVDLEDKKLWNAFRFEVRHAANRENKTIPVTRTFCASKKCRDDWVFAVSEALLMYEKDKDHARKVAVWKEMESYSPCTRKMNLSPERVVRRPNSPNYEEMWNGDRFVSLEDRRTTSPSRFDLRRPSSPSYSPLSHMQERTRSPPPPLPRPGPSRSPAAARWPLQKESGNSFS